MQKVRRALKKLVDLIDERCSDTGCMCDLRGDLCSQQYMDILDEFEAALKAVITMINRQEVQDGME